MQGVLNGLARFRDTAPQPAAPCPHGSAGASHWPWEMLILTWQIAEAPRTCFVCAAACPTPHPGPLPVAAIFWGGFIFNIVDMIVGPTALRNRVDARERQAIRLWNAPHRPW